MILKPLSEMSVEEMHEAIELLRAKREALRNEALTRKAVRVVKETKQRTVARQRSDATELAAKMLAMMQGEDE